MTRMILSVLALGVWSVTATAATPEPADRHGDMPSGGIGISGTGGNIAINSGGIVITSGNGSGNTGNGNFSGNIVINSGENSIVISSGNGSGNAGSGRGNFSGNIIINRVITIGPADTDDDGDSSGPDSGNGKKSP